MGLLYSDEIKLTDAITIVNPKLGEVLDDEEAYFQAIDAFVATPYDRMVELDDIGIDFSEITDFDLFLLTYKRFITPDERIQRALSLVVRGIDFSEYLISKHPERDELYLKNHRTGDVINNHAHLEICAAIRKIVGMPRVNKKPGNAEARKYMIERARVKQKRAAAKRVKDGVRSILENNIVALVNSPEFKYDYESIRQINMYQFTRSLSQVAKRVSYDKIMIGVYAGTVNTKEIDPDILNWMSS